MDEVKSRRISTETLIGATEDALRCDAAESLRCRWLADLQRLRSELAACVDLPIHWLALALEISYWLTLPKKQVYERCSLEFSWWARMF